MTQEFHYRVAWRATDRFPGHHRSAHSGPGLEFTGHAPLLAAPDPRRLDVRASLSDPFEQWLVRTYRQRSSLQVYLLADVSASMAYRGRGHKMRVLADFASALAFSAYRTGDRFAFVACDETPRPDLFLAPGRQRGAGAEIRRRIEAATLGGRNAEGLAAAPALLGKQRALVFLLSDFHFPVAFLHRVLHALSRHDVVPVVLWDAEEFQEQCGYGLRLVKDSESGRHRYLFMRPALRAKLAQASSKRSKALTQAFMAHSLRPLVIAGEFSADAVTQYFYRDYAVTQGNSN